MTPSSIRSLRFPALRSLLSVIVLLSFGFAQTSNTSLSGTVKDSQDRVIAGATLTLTNIATNAVRGQTTNAQGGYSFDLLPPGDYRLEVTAPGFRKQMLDHVHVLIAKATGIDLTLQVGATTDIVEVTAQSGQVQVDTQDASLGNNFVAQQITQLPMEARNVLTLLTLQPGVTKDGYVNGGREDQSNVTLDGVDINESASNAIGPAQSSQALGNSPPKAEQGPVLRLNSEAIEEFRVSTLNSSASAGRSSGAQIALVTKSGTNNWHGAAFEANRNTIFTANDWFNNHAGVARPKLNRNTFGGAVGGPIKKDRAFFFYSYEGRIDDSETPVLAALNYGGTGESVPTASLGQGILKFRLCADLPDCKTPGQTVSLTSADFNKIFPDIGGINPAAVSALAAAAAKYKVNDSTIGDGMNTGGFRFNAPAPVHLHSHNAKLDFNLTNKQSLFVRTSVQYDNWGGTPSYPDTPAPDEWDHPMGLAVGHTWIISNTLVNNLHYGFTRQAFTQGGDTSANYVFFRFVYNPSSQQYPVSRVTPVHNWTDDLSWVKGKHTFQFGAYISRTNNLHSTFGQAFDNALTNPSYYLTGLLRTPLSNYVQSVYGAPMFNGDGSGAENAMAALIGRFTEFTAHYNYDNSLNLMPTGAPNVRNFAGQDYEGYVQDTWKLKSNLTISAGLRYGLARPIYETNGYETQPNVPLGDYLNLRASNALKGIDYTTPISVNLSGPGNGGPPLYNWDYTNFQPRVGVAYSPHFESGLLSRVFGRGEGDSVIRGGFGINGDYFGQSLATFFDNRNTLGFGSSFTVGPNTYDVGCSPYQDPDSPFFGTPGTCSGGVNLGPLFTGFNQPVRGAMAPAGVQKISFPQTQPGDNSLRIESSLDSNLTTPKSYSWNFTYERQLPHKSFVQFSYVGRSGRHLLAQRDAMQPINLVDPQSKMDWYTAGTILAKLRAQGVPTANIAAIPYFENLFPGASAALYCKDDPVSGACVPTHPTWNSTQAIYQTINDVGGDYTTTQAIIDSISTLGANAFYQPQYGALSTWATIGNSNYNSFTSSYKIRTTTLTADFNYTYSHSLDDSSGLQNGAGYNGEAFILNPFRQGDMYSNSDFDIRHQINVNAVWQMPFGHGRTMFSEVGKVANGVIGGWQLSGIFRWNTGLPVGFYNGTTGVFDDARWATNWNVQSNAVRTSNFEACPTRPVDGTPKLFGCNTDFAFTHFRNPYPGETGERNVFRVPGYYNIDMGLGKTFHLNGLTAKIPESHQLQFRWEVFNILNHQSMGAFDSSRSGFGIPLDPNQGNPPDNFSNFTAVQGGDLGRRVMQFLLRYSF